MGADVTPDKYTQARNVLEVMGYDLTAAEWAARLDVSACFVATERRKLWRRTHSDYAEDIREALRLLAFGETAQARDILRGLV